LIGFQIFRLLRRLLPLHQLEWQVPLAELAGSEVATPAGRAEARPLRENGDFCFGPVKKIELLSNQMAIATAPPCDLRFDLRTQDELGAGSVDAWRLAAFVEGEASYIRSNYCRTG
jgi:hypothetical protein